MALTRDKCAIVKDGVTNKETRYRPCDSVGLEAWGLAIRDVCLVSDGMRLVLRERRDKAGTEETLHTVWA